MYIKGITDYSNACVLIALKNMFDAYPYYGQVDWGEEFLVDFFVDYQQSKTFGSSYNYLIEESAPVKLFQTGPFTVHYTQEDLYFRLYDPFNQKRYRLPGSRKIILSYFTTETSAHAVCIPASEVLTYLDNHKFLALFLPKHGLIIDHRTYEQDFPNE